MNIADTTEVVAVQNIRLGHYLNNRSNTMDQLNICNSFSIQQKKMIARFYAYVTDVDARSFLHSHFPSLPTDLFYIKDPSCTTILNDNQVINNLLGYCQSGKSDQIITILYFYARCGFKTIGFIRNIKYKKELQLTHINESYNLFEQIIRLIDDTKVDYIRISSLVKQDFETMSSRSNIFIDYIKTSIIVKCPSTLTQNTIILIDFCEKNIINRHATFFEHILQSDAIIVFVTPPPLDESQTYGRHVHLVQKD